MTFSPCPECGGPGCEFCSWKGSAVAWAERRERPSVAADEFRQDGEFQEDDQ